MKASLIEILIFTLYFGSIYSLVAGFNEVIQPTESSSNVTTFAPPTLAPNTTTPSPNSTTTQTPKTTTSAPNTTTTSTTTTSPTTSSTTTTSTTTSTTTPAPNTTTTSTTPAPTPTTPKPTSQPTPKPEPDRKFDGPSFIGGMILTMGLMAIAFVSWKFYKARTERNYHTL